MMEALLLPLALCFFRISAFVAFLAPFGGQHVPSMVKVGLIVALTAFWAPRGMDSAFTAVSSQETVGTDETPAASAVLYAGSSARNGGSRQWLLWAWLAAREVLFGASLGWLLGMILVPARIAGSWIAEQMGLTIASVTSATDTGSGNVLSVILESCGVLLLYSLSIHHDFLRMFDRFFDDYKVGHVWGLPDSGWVINALTGLPERGLAIAAPLAVMMFLILFILMFAMKQSPQFNLFTFGMPFRLAAGLVAMVVMFPDILANVLRQLQTFLTFPA